MPPRDVAAELIRGVVPPEILPFKFQGIRPDFKSMTPRMRVVKAGGKTFGLIFQLLNKPKLLTRSAMDEYWDVYYRSWAFAVADDVNLVSYDTKIEQFYPTGCSPTCGVDGELFSLAHFSTCMDGRFLAELAKRSPGPLKVIGYDPPFNANGCRDSIDGDRDVELDAATRLTLWTNRWNQAALLSLDFDTYYLQPTVFPAATGDSFLERIYDEHRAEGATGRKGWTTIVEQSGWVAANCEREGFGLFIAADVHRLLFESMRDWSIASNRLVFEYVEGSAEPMQRRYFSR